MIIVLRCVTVVVNVQLSEFPLVSVAVAVTVVVPTGKSPCDCVVVCRSVPVFHEYDILGDVSRPLKSTVASGKS